MDKCPLDPEDFDQFEDADGCPEPDNDRDDVCDPWVAPKGLEARYGCKGSDQCPLEPEDKDGTQDADGCPDPDNDADAICDPWVGKAGEAEKYAGVCVDADKCPDVPEDEDGFQDGDGCPEADNDGDKICDPWVADQGQAAKYAGECQARDKCPDEPETFNHFMDDDGCPDELKIVLRNVRFDTGKATLKPESFPILDEVVDILKRHPHVQEIRIDGHTDSRGTPAANRRLSDRRAAAVRKYLTEQGIEAKRLASKGFGEDQLLIKPEKTDADYAHNRRVEFVILKMAPPPEK